MKNLKNIFEALIDEYTTNTLLLDWCSETFQERPQIFVGSDEEDLPELEGSLGIKLIPGSRSRTRGDSYQSHGLKIIAIVHDTSAREATNALILQSLEYVDSFASILDKISIRKLRSLGVAVTPGEGQEDDVYYPYARAELAYMIEIPSKL